jgi:GxxExxY protein
MKTRKRRKRSGTFFRVFVLSCFRDLYLLVGLESQSRKHEEEEANMGHEFEALSKNILEAALAVHKALGPGFVEPVYQKAMEVALSHRCIGFARQKKVRIVFEEEEVGLHRVDLIVGAEIIVELKAIKGFEDIHYAQVKSYLKATGLHVGLLLNFNAPVLVIKRIVL